MYFPPLPWIVGPAQSSSLPQDGWGELRGEVAHAERGRRAMDGEQGILACFYAFRDALMANDTEALDGLMTQGYRSYNLRGGLEGRELVMEVYGPGSTTLDVWEVSDLQAEVFSEVGVLTGKGFISGTWEGMDWSHHLRFCDIYLKKEGEWQLHLSQATPMADGSAQE